MLRILESRLQLCRSMRTTGTFLLHASLQSTKVVHRMSVMRILEKQRTKRTERRKGGGLPAGEGASVARALEDGGLDMLPGARGVAGARHGLDLTGAFLRREGEGRGREGQWIGSCFLAAVGNGDLEGINSSGSSEARRGGKEEENEGERKKLGFFRVARRGDGGNGKLD